MDFTNDTDSTPTESTEVRSGRFSAWQVPAALLVIFGVAVAYAFYLYAECDDTYIYLVYVKNLFKGNGLTFNGAHVQGFTSVLWTAIIIAVGSLPVALPVLANILSGASGLLAFVAAYLLGRRLGLGKWMALIVPALLAVTGDFAFYMSNGLETIFFTAMTMFSLLFLFSADPGKTLASIRLPLVLVATTLARPEGALVALVVVVTLFLRSSSRPALIRAVVSMVILVVPVLAFQAIYYGDILPNTYYAKAGAGLANAGQGVRYFLNFMDGKLITLVALTYILIYRYSSLGRRTLPISILMILWFGYVTAQGGDNMVGARALIPMMPLVYLYVVVGLTHVPKRYAVFVLVTIAAFQLWKYNQGHAYGSSWDVPIRRQARNWREIHQPRVQVAKYLRENTDPNAVVALNAAGIIPFYSERPVIDMLGLNNRYIARHGTRDRSLPYGHQAGDGKWVLSQWPDVILFGGAGARKGNQFSSEIEIFSHQDFARYYDKKALPLNRVGYFKSPNAPDR